MNVSIFFADQLGFETKQRLKRMQQKNNTDGVLSIVRRQRIIQHVYAKAQI